MLVYIEGTDRTGKSTLAKLIAIHLGCYIEHCSKPKTDDPFSEYKEMIEKAVKHRNLVFDRGYLGEYVYANLWRGGCKITPEQFRELDLISFQVPSIVIHAYASPEVILERCKREGEDLLKPEQIHRCSQLFDEIMKKTALPVYAYDSEAFTPHEYMRKVVQKLIDPLRG